MIRVAICDDHQIVRAGFKQIFSSSGEFEVVAEGATGREALDIARREICDVLLHATRAWYSTQGRHDSIVQQNLARLGVLR